MSKISNMLINFYKSKLLHLFILMFIVVNVSSASIDSIPYPLTGNKLRLGFQTTGDGLVYRGLASADTITKPTNYVDKRVKAYILLDTTTNILWQYKKATNNAWTRLGGSISSGVTGVLPVLNGGTNRITMPDGFILHGDGLSVDTSNQLFYNRTDNRLSLGSILTLGKFDIRQTEDNTDVLYMQRKTDSGGGLGNFLNFKSAQGSVSQYKIDVTGGVTQGRMLISPANGFTLPFVIDAGDTLTPQNTTGFRFRQFMTTAGNVPSVVIEPKRNGDFAYTALLVNPTENTVGTNNSKYLIDLQRNNVSRFVVQSRGNVGINTASPDEKLHVVGNARISGLANAANPVNVQVDVNGVLVRTSSINIKEDVQNLPYGLNEIMLLQPSKFSYIDKYKYGEGYDIGFIAEDVNDVIPEAVGTGVESDVFMDSVKLIPVLVKAIQEQNALIKALEQRILNLENK